MFQQISQLALVVADYDEAIDFYVRKMGFVLLEDTPLSETKRWVRVAPKADGGTGLLLAKAASDEQKSRIGNQTGGRVFLFLETDNFQAAFQRLVENDIEIIRQPSVEEYGTVAVFADLYGNRWDLIGRSEW